MFLLKKMSFITVFILGLSIFLMACSNGSAVGESSPADEKSVDVGYAEYAGEYQDLFSQRATLTAEDLGDALKIMVHWSSSATEASIWTMTAKFTSSDKLSYTDCEYGIVVFDDDDNDSYTKEYEAAEGYFTVTDGKLFWDGAADESCRDCIFEKIN